MYTRNTALQAILLNFFYPFSSGDYTFDLSLFLQAFFVLSRKNFTVVLFLLFSTLLTYFASIRSSSLNCTLCSRISTSRTHLIRFYVSAYTGLPVACKWFLGSNENHSLFAFFEFQKMSFHARKKMIPDPPPAARVVPGQRLSTAIHRIMTSPEAEHWVFFCGPTTWGDQLTEYKNAHGHGFLPVRALWMDTENCDTLAQLLLPIWLDLSGARFFPQSTTYWLPIRTSAALSLLIG